MDRASFVIIKNVSEGGFLFTVPREPLFLEDLPTVVEVKFMGQMLKFSGRLRIGNIKRHFLEAANRHKFNFGQ